MNLFKFQTRNGGTEYEFGEDIDQAKDIFGDAAVGEPVDMGKATKVLIEKVYPFHKDDKDHLDVLLCAHPESYDFIKDLYK